MRRPRGLSSLANRASRVSGIRPARRGRSSRRKKLAIEGAKHTLGGEIGDAVAHRCPSVACRIAASLARARSASAEAAHCCAPAWRPRSEECPAPAAPPPRRRRSRNSSVRSRSLVAHPQQRLLLRHAGSRSPRAARPSRALPRLHRLDQMPATVWRQRAASNDMSERSKALAGSARPARRRGAAGSGLSAVSCLKRTRSRSIRAGRRLIRRQEDWIAG